MAKKAKASKTISKQALKDFWGVLGEVNVLKQEVGVGWEDVSDVVLKKFVHAATRAGFLVCLSWSEFAEKIKYTLVRDEGKPTAAAADGDDMNKLMELMIPKLVELRKNDLQRSVNRSLGLLEEEE